MPKSSARECSRTNPVYPESVKLSLADGSVVQAGTSLKAEARTQWLGFGSAGHTLSVVHHAFTVEIGRDLTEYGSPAGKQLASADAWTALLGGYHIAGAPEVLGERPERVGRGGCLLRRPRRRLAGSGSGVDAVPAIVDVRSSTGRRVAQGMPAGSALGSPCLPA